jgi:hypothetical protein
VANGGQTAIRGYLIQTLIALLDALEDGREWQSVTLEPNVDSDKVDILWKYSDGTKAVQVKSSVNPFSKGDIERWAMELESWREADEYELVLVGIPASPTVARIRKEGTVAVPPPKNLDLPAFKEQAAHRLDRLLQKHDLYRGDADHREMLAGALSEKLATLSTGGHKLTRSALVNLLTGWLASTAETGGVCTVSSKTVRIIRVFVSSPEDVSEERAVLDELCASIALKVKHCACAWRCSPGSGMPHHKLDRVVRRCSMGRCHLTTSTSAS